MVRSLSAGASPGASFQPLMVSSSELESLVSSSPRNEHGIRTNPGQRRDHRKDQAADSRPGRRDRPAQQERHGAGGVLFGVPAAGGAGIGGGRRGRVGAGRREEAAALLSNQHQREAAR